MLPVDHGQKHCLGLIFISAPCATITVLEVYKRTQSFIQRPESEVWYACKEYLKNLRSNILIIQVSLLAFPSFPTFIASGFHLKRNKTTCNFDITSYDDLSLLINNQGRNEALPSWFESCDQVSQVLILIRLTKIIVKQHPPSVIVMLPINYNENNRLEQVWHNHI